MIRKDQKAIHGITISPNPVISSENATVRMTATSNGNIDLKIIDMSGRVMMQQQTRVTEGNNSITLNNLDKLQSGIYLLQMSNGDEVNTVKFTLVR